jgi:hypothetical protein
MIDYFMRNREKTLAKSVLAILYFFIVLLIEPVSYFYLMLRAFNYNLLLTFKIALPTFKTKIRERLMSFGFKSS